MSLYHIYLLQKAAITPHTYLRFQGYLVKRIAAVDIEGSYSRDQIRDIAECVLHDPITERYSINRLEPLYGKKPYLLGACIHYHAGVTDNLARSAYEGIKDFLGIKHFDLSTVLRTQTYYLTEAPTELKGAFKKWLSHAYNPVIQACDVFSKVKGPAKRRPITVRASKAARHLEADLRQRYETIPLRGASDTALETISRSRHLSLNLEEMKCIQLHYKSTKIAHHRRKKNMPLEPTDVEVEALAQTWSEHCKHKIFNATIHYQEGTKPTKTIRSLYKTYIQGTTQKLLQSRPDVLSVFSDNAGVFRFDRDHAICLKVETHNSPCAIEPYGGAITGILGVNRDILGTGVGAKPIFNTDVFCFASPFTAGSLPKGWIHPRRMLQEVHRGIRDGGNQSGIPTVNGAIVFHSSFLGRPLVFCGSGGLMPLRLKGRAEASFVKKIEVGDLITMVGGRIGKDGIHGATVSSEALRDNTPTSSVQIGDPITQKKMIDFLLAARDQNLYRSLSDNGAGGLSSSVGEMALFTGGADLHLDRAPLKYPGLVPWEILISEAQERMTLAVPPSKKKALSSLARVHDVEISFLGSFTDTGYFSLFYEGTLVGDLSMKFLHGGVPTLDLKAVWTSHPPTKRTSTHSRLEKAFKKHFQGDHQALLMHVLSRPNIASKEFWVRQYDHEVQGRTIVKPFAGVDGHGPMNAAILRPIYASDKGLGLASGLSPKYSACDGYVMAQRAVDEAVCNAVASGVDPQTLVGLDNFAWPDPVASKDNPDGAKKLGTLVRANLGLRDICMAYRLPMISGKDSMKNDAMHGKQKKSILPTLLFTVAGTLPSIEDAMTSDWKQAGSYLYVIGITEPHLGLSDVHDSLHLYHPEEAPHVTRLTKTFQTYQRLYEAIQAGLILSCHDLSDGGLIVTLSESAIGGMIGAQIEIKGSHLYPLESLYSESPSRFVIEVSPDKHKPCLECLRATSNLPLWYLGRTHAKPTLQITCDGSSLMTCDLSALRNAWKTPLESL